MNSITDPKSLWMALAVISCTLLLFSVPSLSQTTEAPPKEAPEDTSLTSIPLEDLPTVSLSAMELMDDTRQRLLADSTLLAIGALVPSAASRVDSLCSKSEELMASQPTIRRLRNLESDWQALIAEVDQWQVSVAERISAIGEELGELSRLRQSWQMTEARAGLDRLPGEIVTGIARTVSELEETEDLLFQRRNRLLLLGYQVADLETRCLNRIDLASNEANRIREKLLVADAAPLWNPAAISEADDHLGQKIRNTLADHLHSIRTYVKAEPTRVWLHLAVFVASAIGIAFLGRYAGAHSDGDPVMARAAEILRNPVPAAFLVAVVLDGAVHIHPPGAWTLFVNLPLLVPLITLAPRLLNIRLRIAAYILAVVYLADGVLELLPQHSFAGRIVRLAIKVILIVTALSLMRRMYLPGVQPPGTRRRLAAFVLGAALCVLAASGVAGLVGHVSLANMLLEGVLDTFYLGLLIWLAVVVLRNVITVILKTDTVQRTNIVRKNGETLRLWIRTAINIGGIVTWLTVVLDGFKILSPAFDGLKHAILSPHKVGSIEIALGDIGLFLFIIWLSFLISRILRAILRDEVYPRVTLAHGVPMAISKLTHYALMVIGFFFAMGASGIDLNKFTLLAGAMGVGIGFGLQNIVSNLVSGIIVLFERPVQTGDKVKIGTNEGEIKRIGLRATVIRNWEGAEVMVPNSHLVLEEVTNWTLSDQQRRMEIVVGVAYGSDTEKVTETLLNVAKEHNDVLEYPEPYVLFTDFGDSSLNFSLRAWAGRFGDYLRVRSELTSAVNKALAKAGVTIPFPQRDVHMNLGEQGHGPDSSPGAPGKES